ncbi:MAG: hypothetical protein ACYTXA_07460 [Nostoc sp.]
MSFTETRWLTRPPSAIALCSALPQDKHINCYVLDCPLDRLDTSTEQSDLALGEVVQLVEAIARHLRPAEPLHLLKELEQGFSHDN